MFEYIDEVLLNIVKDVVIVVGEVIMILYDEGDFESYQKVDELFVISVDYKVNEIICQYFKFNMFDILILLEEIKYVSFEE